jgi:hypothetical protein
MAKMGLIDVELSAVAVGVQVLMTALDWQA